MIRNGNQQFPPRFEIAQAWSFDPRLVPSLDTPLCFACQHRPVVRMNGSQRASWDSADLERCHLVAHSIGGSTHPENLMLLCKRCHLEAPMTNNREIMLTWVRNRELWESWAKREALTISRQVGLSADDLRRLSAMSISDVVAQWDRMGVDFHRHTANSLSSAIAALKLLADEREMPIEDSEETERFLMLILRSIGQIERDMVSRRTREGLERARLQGKKLGPRQRVFRRDEAVRLRGEGLSWREIAKKLDVPASTVRDAVASQDTPQSHTDEPRR